MKLYLVRFSASHYDSQHPDYRQGYEAFELSGQWCASHNEPGRVTVLQKRVASFSESAIEAIFRFIKWQETGLPESWLTDETAKASLLYSEYVNEINRHPSGPANYCSYLQWLEIELQNARNLLKIKTNKPKARANGTAYNKPLYGSRISCALPNGF